MPRAAPPTPGEPPVARLEDEARWTQDAPPPGGDLSAQGEPAPTEASPPPPAEGEPAAPRTEAVGAGAEADGPAAQDAMGFSAYVSALARFLRESQDGLTVSIEGEWGSGKSSFMDQLATELDDASTLVVRFNPWHHDDLRTLSAAFTEAFVQAAREEMRKDHLVRQAPAPDLDRIQRFVPLRAWLRRARYGLHVYRVERGLDAYRADSDRPGLVALWAVAALLAVALVALTLAGVPLPGVVLGALGAQEVASAVPSATYTLGGLAAAGGSLFKLVRSVRDALDPVGRSLRAHATKDRPEPDYVPWLQGRLPEVLRRYVKDKRVYVLVDDLDRCTPQQAAETLLAINRIIEGGGKKGRPPMIFLLGLDREKVAAGLAVKNHEVLTYLGEDAPDDETPAARERRLRRDGMRYGHEFIEKFVQVPFRIPQPSTRDVEGYLRSLSRTAPPAGAPSSTRVELPDTRPRLRRILGSLLGERHPVVHVGMLVKPAVDPAVQAQRDRAQREIDLLLGEESDRLRGIFARLAPALNSNPRRLKYALNLFRLRARIAAETDLFTAAPGRAALTFEQLAKLVVLTIRRPALISDVEQDPRLLLDLEALALSRAREEGRTLAVPVPGGALRQTSALREWSSKEDVLDILRVGLVPPGATPEDAPAWLLRDSPFPWLLKTIPRVRTVGARAASSPQTAPVRLDIEAPAVADVETPPVQDHGAEGGSEGATRAREVVQVPVSRLEEALRPILAALASMEDPDSGYAVVRLPGLDMNYVPQESRDGFVVEFVPTVKERTALPPDWRERLAKLGCKAGVERAMFMFASGERGAMVAEVVARTLDIPRSATATMERIVAVGAPSKAA